MKETNTDVWDRLIQVRWWEFVRNNRKELVLHLLYNRFRITLLTIGG